MQLIGFLTNHDSYPGVKHSLRDMVGITDNPPELVGKVLNYLQHGRMFEGFMDWVYDAEDETEELDIGGSEYFTDGIWIWPMYFAYYLKKYPSYILPQDFVDYLAARDFMPPTPTEEDEKRAYKYFHNSMFGQPKSAL